MFNNIIEIIGISLSFVLGLISLIFAIKSYNMSKKANLISNEANDIALKSLKISQDNQNEQKENIIITAYKNLEILKTNPSIQYIGNHGWDDYLLIVPVEIKNKSSKPVSIKRPFFFWGNHGDYLYVGDDEFYYIEGYNQKVNFPYYMKEKETIHIDIIIGITSSDRLKFYSNNGITLTFEGTTNNYKKYFSATSVIDNNSD